MIQFNFKRFYLRPAWTFEADCTTPPSHWLRLALKDKRYITEWQQVPTAWIKILIGLRY